MLHECLNCGQEILQHAVKDVPYRYKAFATVVPKIAGWHCAHCHEVEFDAGEGERFADAIKRFAAEIDARESAELGRFRKKLKLTQVEAARITGGGPNAFSRDETGKARPLAVMILPCQRLVHFPASS